MYLAVVTSIENPILSTNLNSLNSRRKKRLREPEVDTVRQKVYLTSKFIFIETFSFSARGDIKI